MVKNKNSEINSITNIAIKKLLVIFNNKEWNKIPPNGIGIRFKSSIPGSKDKFNVRSDKYFINGK